MLDNRGAGTFVTDETELTTNSLDLFTLPKIEKVLEKGSSVEINTVSALTNNGPFEFRVCRDPDNFLALHQTRLSGTVRVLKDDDAEVGANDSLSICNLFAHSLFSQVELYVDGVNVNDMGTSTYAIKAFVETLFSYDEGAKKTHLLMEGWLQDDAGHEDSIPTAQVTTTNNAYNLRRNLIAGKDFNFNILLHVDFLQSRRYLIPNTELLLKLYRNSDSYSLMSQNLVNKIVIKDLKLHVRKIKVNNEFSKPILDRLSREPVLYPVMQSKIRFHNIPANVNKVTIQSVITGPLPQSIIIGFLSQGSFNGDINANPFAFRHFNCNEINLKIGSESFHKTLVRPDFTNGKFLNEYRLLLEHTGIHHSNYTNNLTLEHFKGGCFFTAFDFSADLSKMYFYQIITGKYGKYHRYFCVALGNGFHLLPKREGYCDIDLGFSPALADPIYMVMFLTYPTLIKIDVNRNVQITSLP